ncbi:hypothetical protein IP88_15375 [alpha proteobacterium AAP81b]|nr:hypothetical protein IP88_15375 [alpha proteobacterium AAP81b]
MGIELATMYIPAGIAIGLGGAAPVGPINLVVIQRALAGRRTAAVTIGIGAALADMAFALAAAFGLGAIGIALDRHDTALRLAGGLLLIGFAVYVWRSAPHIEASAPPVSRRRLLAMGLTMALTNPANLLFFVGSLSAVGLAGLGHDSDQARANSLLVGASVFVGAMAWWLFVTTLASRLRGRLSDARLAQLNHGTAIALAVFGVGAIVAGVMSA